MNSKVWKLSAELKYHTTIMFLSIENITFICIFGEDKRKEKMRVWKRENNETIQR